MLLLPVAVAWPDSFFLGLPFLAPSRSSGTSIIQVTATDADDPTYGNSAKLVYTLVQGQQYFSVDPQTGERALRTTQHLIILASRLGVIIEIPFFFFKKSYAFWFYFGSRVVTTRAVLAGPR